MYSCSKQNYALNFTVNFFKSINNLSELLLIKSSVSVFARASLKLKNPLLYVYGPKLFVVSLYYTKNDQTVIQIIESLYKYECS